MPVAEDQDIFAGAPKLEDYDIFAGAPPKDKVAPATYVASGAIRRNPEDEDIFSGAPKLSPAPETQKVVEGPKSILQSVFGDTVGGVMDTVGSKIIDPNRLVNRFQIAAKEASGIVQDTGRPMSASQAEAQDARAAGPMLGAVAQTVHELPPIRPAETDPMYWTGKAIEKVATYLEPGAAKTAAEVVGGGVEGMSELIAGFSTPENLALLKMLPQGIAAQAVALGIFETQAILATPEQWKAFQEAPDIPTKTKIATHIVGSHLLPLLGGAKLGVEAVTGRAKGAATEPPVPEPGKPVVESEVPPAPLPPERAPETVVSETARYEPTTAGPSGEGAVVEGNRGVSEAPLGEGARGITEAVPEPVRSTTDVPPARNTSKPEQLTPQEYWAQKARPISEGWNTGKFGLRGEIYASAKEAGRAMATYDKANPIRLNDPHYKEVARAIDNGEPVSAAAIEHYGFSKDLPTSHADHLPADYTLEGDLYIRKAEPVRAAVDEAPPVGSEAVGEGIPSAIAQVKENMGATPGEVAPAMEAKAAREAPKVEPAEPEVTGIANEVTAAERLKRGVPEAEEPGARPWTEVVKEAEGRDAEGAALVAELKDNPRALSDTEDAMLLREQVKAQLAHDAAVKRVNENPDDPSAQAQLEKARDRVQEIYDVDKSVGTEAGRGFNARKILMAQDFTLAKMEATVRAEANKGKPLSPKQATRIKEIHTRIEKANRALSKFDAEMRLFAEARKTPNVEKPAFLQGAYERAKQRIIDRRGRLNTGVDPSALADEAIIGAYHIGRGVNTFAKWSRTMIEELGDRIKPYLRDLWERSKNAHVQSEKALAAAQERKLAADKRRIQSTTDEFHRRTEAKDTSPLTRRREQLMDKEKTRLLFERENARGEYHRMLSREKFKQSHIIRKVGHYTAEALVGIPRAIKSAFDLSAVFRQGGLIVSGRPVIGGKNLAPMFKALASAEGQFSVMEGIKTHPKYARSQQAKLDITDTGAKMSKREEVFRSELAEKIPGVEMSERAYTTYLNKLRMDTFDAMTGLLEKVTKQKVTPAQERVIANYINVASGRGNMGRFAPSADALSKVFWSPRLAVSRIQYLTGQPLWHKAFSGEKGGAAVRLLVAGEYARTLAGIGAMVALGTAAGAALEKDPRSGNFGLRFGNTRIDISAGLKGYITYFARLLSHKVKTAKGEELELGSRYGAPTVGSLTWNLLRGKASPGPGSVFNMMEGENVIGQPTTPLNEALTMYLPLTPGDVGDALKAEGVPQKAILSLLAIGGMSTANYEPTSEALKRGARTQLEERDAALLVGDLKKAWELTFNKPTESPSQKKTSTRLGSALGER